MKKIIRKIAAWIIRKYFAKVAGATLDWVDAKVDNGDRIARVCSWVQVSTDILGEYAKALEDGTITPDEREILVKRMNAIAEGLADLLTE